MGFGRRYSVTEPPPLWNSSCQNEQVWRTVDRFSATGFVKSSILSLFALITISLNLIFILVLTNRRYRREVHVHPRYYLVAIAYNCLINGISIVLTSVFTSSLHCWPLGEFVCRAQAILQGALNQHYALLVISMSLDRYFRMASPYSKIFRKVFSRKYTALYIISSWFISLSAYSVWIVPSRSYFYNSEGLQQCELFYYDSNVKIFTSCFFYFSPTMAMMYSYGTIFHNRKIFMRAGLTKGAPLKVHQLGSDTSEQQPDVDKNQKYFTAGLLFSSVLANPQQHFGIIGRDKSAEIDPLKTPRGQIESQLRRGHYLVARTMAAMSLCFIIVLTPRTINDVIISCVGPIYSTAMDFFVTLIGISYCVWNPLIYWVFNEKFRTATVAYIRAEVLCHREARERGCCHAHSVQSQPQEGVSALMANLQPVLHPIMENESRMVTKWETTNHTFLEKKERTTQRFFDPGIIYPLSMNSSEHTEANSFQEIGEVYWGEILEKSVSFDALPSHSEDIRTVENGETTYI